MRPPPCSCFLVVTALMFLCYCTSESGRQLPYVGETSVQEPTLVRSWTAQRTAGGTEGGRCTGSGCVCLGGWGWTRVVCAKTSRCVGAVRLGPVSDTPSLGGVGAAGCTIMSPWALCNYALT